VVFHVSGRASARRDVRLSREDHLDSAHECGDRDADAHERDDDPNAVVDAGPRDPKGRSQPEKHHLVLHGGSRTSVVAENGRTDAMFFIGHTIAGFAENARCILDLEPSRNALRP
jgi:hypothetical protein